MAHAIPVLEQPSPAPRVQHYPVERHSSQRHHQGTHGAQQQQATSRGTPALASPVMQTGYMEEVIPVIQTGYMEEVIPVIHTGYMEEVTHHPTQRRQQRGDASQDQWSSPLEPLNRDPCSSRWGSNIKLCDDLSLCSNRLFADLYVARLC